MSTLLYGCERWTQSIASENKIRSLEMKCYRRRLLGISWRERKTNECVLNKVKQVVGWQTVPRNASECHKKEKTSVFGHQMRRWETMVKTVMEGTVEGKRSRGRRIEDNSGLNIADPVTTSLGSDSAQIVITFAHPLISTQT